MARINPPTRQPRFGLLFNRILTRMLGKPFPSVALLGHNGGFLFGYLMLSAAVGNGKTKLPLEVKMLATQLVAQTNGCGFCTDLGQRLARDRNLGPDKMVRVLEYETRPQFTLAERAALRYAWEATQVGARVQERTFAELRQHFSEREILELTVVVATENFYTRLTGPLEVVSQEFCAIPLKPSS